MPQLIMFALLGVGFYAGYRWFVHADKLAESFEDMPDPTRPARGGAIEKDMGKLEYDATSGVYRPSQRD
jgi:hypothetical protein